MTSGSDRRRWAVAQMTSTGRVDENLRSAERLIETAAGLGAELVALPENTTFMGNEADKASVAEPLEGGSTVAFLSDVARRCGVFVLLGSFTERSADPARPHNTSVLIEPEGRVSAVYRKIHLFDVDVAGDRAYRESDRVTPGQPAPVLADVRGVRVGLTICFDLRFPWLYQALRGKGAQVLFVPAAFTVPTGRDHWEVLLRARAIENQCFLLAPAQFGTHETGRQTFGRSLIINPWGTVLATVPDGGDVAVATLDLGRLEELRARMPMVSREP